ncbi:MAG: hypothetical protein PHW21_04585 [Candidatus Izemoplasmatales bacterium]|nr:hypothetical protein [Candidatus Izemoplasmatales bacterium]
MGFYCETFAGMSSNLMFNFYEIMIISLLCCLIYLFVKLIFNGYGGRLGSVAFISTLFIALILGEKSIVLAFQYDFYLIIITAIICVSIPISLQIFFKYNVVLTSALPSLIFMLGMLIIGQEDSIYTLVFLPQVLQECQI